MVHLITQETFDNAVKENMEEFDMPVDEAIADTIKQFEAQGADLSRVIVDLMATGTDAKPVIDAITALTNHIKENKAPEEYITELNTIQKECNKNIQIRVIAGKQGAYNVILDIMKKHPDNDQLLKECLVAMTSLTIKHPDILDPNGVEMIMSILKTKQDDEILKSVLKWAKECCVLHEYNRQHIFDAGIIDLLKPMLQSGNSALICSVLPVFRALVLDDDIRVEFGKSHEHARIIASDTLYPMTALLEKFKTDEALMNEILMTLSALLVRAEFCKQVLDAGGLPILHNALVRFSESDKVIRQCMKVLKALAGNDECKSKIVKDGAAPLIVEAMNKNMDSALTGQIGLGCMAALTLRSPDNSEAFFQAGGPKMIIGFMQTHPDNETIHRNASWAIRNMVSRSRHQNKEFINLDVETLLQAALKKFKKCEYDIKAALRDLDCKVDFKEEWTGKGGAIYTENRE